jgi:hypothetical protein
MRYRLAVRRGEAGGGRGALTSELVELLRGAPELVAFGREGTLSLASATWTEAHSLGRRDAFVRGSRMRRSSSSPAHHVGVLRWPSPRTTGTLDGLIATLALLAFSSFDAWRRCRRPPRAAGTLAPAPRARARGSEPAVRDRGIRCADAASRAWPRGVTARYGVDGRSCSTAST